MVYTPSALAAAFVTSGFALTPCGRQGVSLPTTGMAIHLHRPSAAGRWGAYVAAVSGCRSSVGGQLIHLLGWRSIFPVMGLLGAGSIADPVFLKGEGEACGERLHFGGTLVYATSMIAPPAAPDPARIGAVLLALALQAQRSSPGSACTWCSR